MLIETMAVGSLLCIDPGILADHVIYEWIAQHSFVARKETTGRYSPCAKHSIIFLWLTIYITRKISTNRASYGHVIHTGMNVDIMNVDVDVSGIFTFLYFVLSYFL